MKTNCELDQEPALTDLAIVVDEMLLEIEMAKTVEERERCEAKLTELVNTDPEAARTYEAHCMLEKELRALFESPCYRAELNRGPVRSFFRRLRRKFWPGPVG